METVLFCMYWIWWTRHDFYNAQRAELKSWLSYHGFDSNGFDVAFHTYRDICTTSIITNGPLREVQTVLRNEIILDEWRKEVGLVDLYTCIANNSINSLDMLLSSLPIDGASGECYAEDMEIVAKALESIDYLRGVKDSNILHWNDILHGYLEKGLAKRDFPWFKTLRNQKYSFGTTFLFGISMKFLVAFLVKQHRKMLSVPSRHNGIRTVDIHLKIDLYQCVLDPLIRSTVVMCIVSCFVAWKTCVLVIMIFSYKSILKSNPYPMNWIQTVIAYMWIILWLVTYPWEYISMNFVLSMFVVMYVYIICLQTNCGVIQSSLCHDDCRTLVIQGLDTHPCVSTVMVSRYLRQLGQISLYTSYFLSNLVGLQSSTSGQGNTKDLLSSFQDIHISETESNHLIHPCIFLSLRKGTLQKLSFENDYGVDDTLAYEISRELSRNVSLESIRISFRRRVMSLWWHVMCFICGQYRGRIILSKVGIMALLSAIQSNTDSSVTEFIIDGVSVGNSGELLRVISDLRERGINVRLDVRGH